MEVINTRIGAYGIIIQDDKIVLVEKAGGGYKGKFDLPGGGIEHTEIPDQALKREIKEETGAQVLHYELFDVTATNIRWQMNNDVWEDLHHIGILYNVKINDNVLKEIPDGLDSNGAHWYDIKMLDKDSLTPFASYALEKLGYL